MSDEGSCTCGKCFIERGKWYTRMWSYRKAKIVYRRANSGRCLGCYEVLNKDGTSSPDEHTQKALDGREEKRLAAQKEAPDA